MYMTDNEIEVMYRQAKFPEAQVQVLADLNSCSLSDMRRKLAELGLREMKETPRRILPPREQNWMQINDDAARKLYARGLKDRAVADELGCTLYTIRQWRRANTVPAQKTRTPRMDVDRAMELYLQGKSDEQIADEIRASKSGVASWRFRNHLPAVSVAFQDKKAQAHKPSWARIDFDTAKALYDQMMSDEEMSLRLGCSVYAVGQWRKAYHFPSVKAVRQQQEREAKREMRKAAAQAGKLVLHGTLGGTPLKITIEIGV